MNHKRIKVVQNESLIERLIFVHIVKPFPESCVFKLSLTEICVNLTKICDLCVYHKTLFNYFLGTLCQIKA